MSDLVTPVVTLNEEVVARAITDPKVTPFSDKYSIQELQANQYITTPKDTPLLTKLLAKGSVRSASWMFEWNEAVLSANFAGAVYDGADTSVIDEANGATTRAFNHIMALGQIARAGGLAQSFDTVDGDALKIEMSLKYPHLLRSIEYYLWNGNFTTSNLQTDGVVTLVTTAVANGAVSLVETKLDEAIVAVINAGGQPSDIFASPTVCARIANFAKNRIQYVDQNSATGGVGQKGFYYNTAFGYTIMVNPVRTDFLPTGTAYVLDMDLLTLRHSGADVVQAQPQNNVGDGVAVLFKSYVGLELKAKTKHRVITGIVESIA